jgi:hypothetical protein
MKGTNSVAGNEFRRVILCFGCHNEHESVFFEKFEPAFSALTLALPQPMLTSAESGRIAR